MIPIIMNEMIRYFGKDVRRINHALKVYAFAQQIGRLEKLDAALQRTLETAALLHDIGIPEAERKYASSAGHYQELEGPPVASGILNLCGAEPQTISRVLCLIGHHHQYAAIDGIDFQILIEADFLVNLYEDALDKESAEKAVRKYFKTASGIALANSMYL